MTPQPLTPLQHRLAERLLVGQEQDPDSAARAIVTTCIQNPGSMPREVYLQMQALLESMELDCAMGHDSLELDERMHEIHRLMDTAPWTLDPDEGCVPKGSVKA